MSYMKGVRSGAEGNRSLLKEYGGNSGSGPAARQHYASGGAVKSGNPSLNEGLSAADGKAAKPSLARPGRKMPGSKKNAKGGKTNVNVIIAQAPPKGPDAMPPALGAGPPPSPPMPPPGPGPGGPPMPMRASGGRISNLGKYAHGGKVGRAEGGRAEISKDSLRYAREQRKKADEAGNKRNFSSALGAATGVASAMPGSGKVLRAFNIGNTAVQAASAMGHQRDRNEALTRADRAERGLVTEGEEDRKSGGRVNRDGGGPVGLKSNGMTVGSGGGLGRLAKARKYGK